MLNVIVQSHPARKRRARLLAHQLDARIVTDPRPAEQPPNPWRSYERCIATADPYAWTLIIQDDALPHRDLLAVLGRVMLAHGRELVCLYHGAYPQNNAVRMMMASDRGLAYAECRATMFVPAVALLWPPHLVAAFQRWIPHHPVAADDEMISRFLTQGDHGRRGDTYLVTVPSLVDHDESEPSLMGTTRKLRGALVPPPADVSGVDWAGSFLPYL